MMEEQRVLLQEKHKQEDMDRLKRGLPQRWGTIKPDEEDGATDPSIGMFLYVSVLPFTCMYTLQEAIGIWLKVNTLN